MKLPGTWLAWRNPEWGALIFLHFSAKFQICPHGTWRESLVGGHRAHIFRDTGGSHNINPCQSWTCLCFCAHELYGLGGWRIDLLTRNLRGLIVISISDMLKSCVTLWQTPKPYLRSSAADTEIREYARKIPQNNMTTRWEICRARDLPDNNLSLLSVGRFTSLQPGLAVSAASQGFPHQTIRKHDIIPAFESRTSGHRCKKTCGQTRASWFSVAQYSENGHT